MKRIAIIRGRDTFEFYQSIKDGTDIFETEMIDCIVDLLLFANQQGENVESIIYAVKMHVDVEL